MPSRSENPLLHMLNQTSKTSEDQAPETQQMPAISLNPFLEHLKTSGADAFVEQQEAAERLVEEYKSLKNLATKAAACLKEAGELMAPLWTATKQLYPALNLQEEEHLATMIKLEINCLRDGEYSFIHKDHSPEMLKQFMNTIINAADEQKRSSGEQRVA